MGHLIQLALLEPKVMRHLLPRSHQRVVVPKSLVAADNFALVGFEDVVLAHAFPVMHWVGFPFPALLSPDPFDFLR
jgi:hypothetical protein